MYNDILLPDDDEIPAAKQLAESPPYNGRYVNGHYQTRDPNAPDFLCCNLGIDLSYDIKPKKETEAEFNARYAKVPIEDRRTAYQHNPSKWSDWYFEDVIKKYRDWKRRDYQPLAQYRDDFLSLQNFAKVMRLERVGTRGWQSENQSWPFYMPEETFRQYQTYIDDTNVARYNAMLFAQKSPEYWQWKEKEQEQEKQLLRERQQHPLLAGYPTDMTFKAQAVLLDRLEREAFEKREAANQQAALAFNRMSPQERKKQDQDWWQQKGREMRAARRLEMPWWKGVFYGGDNDDQSAPANKPVHTCSWQNVLAIVILLAIIIIIVVVVAGIVCKPETHKYLRTFYIF